jgi:hypothetical protein
MHGYMGGKVMEKRGLEFALEYLERDYPIRVMTDRLYLLAHCTGKVESLGRSLRREARKPDNTNRVNVSDSPDESGRDVAYYTWNSDYKPPDRQKTTVNPSWYWFTLKSVPVASPMYLSIEDLKRDPMYSEGCKIWRGSHEAPILVEPEAV